MNPMAQAAMGSVLRHLLSMGSGYLVSRGVWSEQDASAYVTAASMALVAVLWSLWEKHAERVKLLVGLTSPSGTTESEVERKIAAGLRSPVTTPKHVVPLASLASSKS